VDAFLTPREAAALLARSSRALRRYRERGNGPAYYKFGGAVRYRMRDLLAWAEQRRPSSDNEEGLEPGTR